MGSKYPKNVLTGDFNINSFQNKLKSLNELIKHTFDIFLLSESKFDSSFPNSKFLVSGYRIVRKDQNKDLGGILFYINEDIF